MNKMHERADRFLVRLVQKYPVATRILLLVALVGSIADPLIARMVGGTFVGVGLLFLGIWSGDRKI